MNCANHPDTSALAFCRTCGKPLCAHCTRDVRGVIYCENCLAARVESTMPPAAAVPPGGVPPRPVVVPTGGPNPALAGILAGFFPFGVGAVYTSQYAKGLAHLVIFTILVWGQTAASSPALHTMLGLGLAFFYVYQIIDAVRSARAIQLGMAPPDPFGLGQSFGGNDKMEPSKQIPIGAVVLIGLGVLFLLHTLGVLEFGFERFWPVILIAVGGWMFARRYGLIGDPQAAGDCARCRSRGLMWPSILLTLGFLALLDQFDVRGADLGRTWPVLLLVIGGVKLLQSNASTEGHMDKYPPLPPVGPDASASSQKSLAQPPGEVPSV